MKTVTKWIDDNPLVEHDLIQGTDEWLTFRLSHNGSSEAAPMLGLSKKTSRTELLGMKSSGIAKEFSDFVQKNILDYGHEVEALARPIIEKQLGRRLYPVVCSRGSTSASCDGKTMAGDVAWEHKQWNEALAESVRNNILPEEHKPQCQQHLLVTSAEKLIFTVSDGTEENMVSMEVLPDMEWFGRIIAGWEQFNKDRASYVPRVIAERPAAEVVIELPALFVHARGEITTHNMDEFGKALTAKLAEVRAIVLATDQDFSNAKESAKKFRETAKEIALSKEQMLAQTETIGEAARKMDAWAKDLNATALQLEKDVEREDKAKKTAMVNEARLAFSDHIDALHAQTKPIDLNIAAPNFAEALKNKRSYTSMQDAIDTALANGKVAADAIAKDVAAKLAWCKEHAAGMSMLFPDLQQLIVKPQDDFELVIKTRIKDHQEAEAAKIEAIRKEEEAKAEAKVRAEAVEAEEKRLADLAAVEVVAEVAPPVEQVDTVETKPAPTLAEVLHASAPTAIAQAITPRTARPTDDEIIGALAVRFSVSEQTVCGWLAEMKVAA